ncbi:YhdP family protein [Limnohabitans sp. T6-5]|uniref:YhdP family protein n=1 Tax=Limnohabitans sp. T6-5 TaxID=1100724 RepID=UPI001E2D69E3|nr:YhdP family protein [Limnohabitans sp. T6-5]
MLSLPRFPRLNAAFSRAWRVLAWGLLALGLVLGMAWGVLHFWIVPRIGDYRPDLERLAGRSIGVPVRIGQLTAESTGWAPSFELRDIELLDVQGRTALRLPRVMVAISVRSLLGLGLEQLVLDSPELDVRRTAQGHWQVAGLDMQRSPQGDSDSADWLFAQREVIVRGGTVRWTDEQATTPLSTHPQTAPQTLALRELDVVLRNSIRHHEVRLDATPPEGWGARFVVMARMGRGILSTHPGRLADWSGPVYAYFPQVDLPQWQQQIGPQLQQMLPKDLGIRSGHGALRVWSDVALGQWTGGTADVDLTDLQVEVGTKQDEPPSPLVFERLSGRVAGRLSATGFELSTRDLAFASSQISAHDLAWPGGNMALEVTHAQGSSPAKGRLQADHLDLQALREVALHLPLPTQLAKLLEQREISGELASLQWRWQGDWQAPPTYSVQASLNRLSLPPAAWAPVNPSSTSASAPPAWPGVRDAQLKLDMTETNGRVQLSMDEGAAVFLPGILEESEVPVRSLQADASWKRQKGRWDVPQWRLQLANADLQGEWHGQWHSAPGGHGPGVLDLQGQITQADVARAHRYLPVHLSAQVRHYVRDAWVKGSYNNVQVKIKGDLSRLPFANAKEGEFRFAGRLRDVDFDYIPAALLPAPVPPAKSLPWPRLTGVNGLLVFDRLSMKLSDASARFGEGRTAPALTSAQAEIADMSHNATVNVSLEHKGPATQLLAAVQQSPVDRLLGGVLHDTQATGTLQTRLKLSLPLQALHNTKVQGSVVLTGNDLRITPAMPTLSKAQGTLQFTENGLGLQGVQARWLGGPVRIDGALRLAPGDNDPPALLRMQGQISADGLREAKDVALANLLARHASGSTSYTATLGWRSGQPELTVQSQLEGLALKLPAPLGKSAASSLPLSLRTRVLGQGGQLRDQIQLELGRIASVNYLRDLSGAAPVVLRGSLTLGATNPQAAALPDSGVSATVALDQLLVDEWEALWPASAAPSPGAATAQSGIPAELLGYVPTRMALQVGTLTADGRTLHQVVAGGTRDGLTWRANVDARELDGHLAFRQATEEQPGQLYARLARLNLPPSSVAAVETLLEAPPINLPALDIVIEQLELRGKKLGRVEIEAVNSEPQRTRGKSGREWQLNKFNLSVPEATLRSTGKWMTASDGNNTRKTEMNFRLDVNNAGALLTRLGTPEALRGGTGQLEGQISWQGSPMALHYPSLSGQFAIKMGRGQFLKADAGAAKLLGVLSLQALPRRLLLDFRDVFSEGFAFDSVQGDVSILQGMAHTQNLQIKGINALVQLEGLADIAHETQKLHVLILPEVDAGTASLLAGIAVNPVVGLTSFLAQLFLQNPLARANSQEFLIDGSWTEPRVTRIVTPVPNPAPRAP